MRRCRLRYRVHGRLIGHRHCCHIVQRWWRGVNHAAAGLASTMGEGVAMSFISKAFDEKAAHTAGDDQVWLTPAGAMAHGPASAPSPCIRHNHGAGPTRRWQLLPALDRGCSKRGQTATAGEQTPKRLGQPPHPARCASPPPPTCVCRDGLKVPMLSDTLEAHTTFPPGHPTTAAHRRPQ